MKLKSIWFSTMEQEIASNFRTIQFKNKKILVAKQNGIVIILVVIGFFVGFLAFLIIFVVYYGIFTALSKNQFEKDGQLPLMTKPFFRSEETWKTIIENNMHHPKFNFNNSHHVLIDDIGLPFFRKRVDWNDRFNSEKRKEWNQEWTLLQFPEMKRRTLVSVYLDHGSILIQDIEGRFLFGKTNQDSRDKLNLKNFTEKSLFPNIQWWKSWYLSFNFFERVSKTLTINNIWKNKFPQLHDFVNFEGQNLIALGNENAYRCEIDAKHFGNHLHTAKSAEQNTLSTYLEQTTSSYVLKLGTNVVRVGDPFSPWWFPVRTPYRIDAQDGKSVAISCSATLFCIWIKKQDHLMLLHRFLDIFHLGYVKHARLEKKIPTNWNEQRFMLPSGFTQYDILSAKTYLHNHNYYVSTITVIEKLTGNLKKLCVDMEIMQIIA